MTNLQKEQNKLNISIQNLNQEKIIAKNLLRLSVKFPKVKAIYKKTINDYINHITQSITDF